MAEGRSRIYSVLMGDLEENRRAHAREERFLSPFVAERGYVDDIILPHENLKAHRPRVPLLIYQEFPWKKHGTFP